MVLGWPLSKLCPVIPTSNQDGRQAKNRKKGGDSLVFFVFQQYFNNIEGPGGSMNYVSGLPNNSYKPITKIVWVRAQLCILQKRVHSILSHK
jgi:hypothetical protein